MTREEHLLVILMEECNETAHRASKALRFGLDEVQPGQELSNKERLGEEFCHIVAMVKMLFPGELIFEIDDIDKKMVAVEKFLEYSKQLGTLTVKS